jgi:uncharacterized repeat protein (TIGR01451 family)
MNSSIQNPKPNGIVPPSMDASKTVGTPSAVRTPPGRFTLAGLLVALVLLLVGAPAAHADRQPTNCYGSALGINLFTSIPDVHIGDKIFYSVNVFNGIPNSGRIACDATGIQASIITPDGKTNVIALLRTTLHNGEADYYPDVVSYVVRAQDILPDGSVRATAVDEGDIHQNDTNSRGGGNQGVNTEVNLPCVLISAQCVGSVGENGAIVFTGMVTNCGNNTLVGVTVTNFNDNGSFTVLFPTNLAIGQVASFSGSWVPANPCLPSTATLTVLASDQFTSTPQTVTSFTTITCQNTLTPGIQVTKVCPAQPASPGQLLTFSGSVTNTGNVTLTDIVVVNNQPAPNTPVFTQASLAPGAVANFTGSYLAPANCSVADTLTATATSRCGGAVSSTASATCPILTAPQIAITAVCPPTPIVPGGTLTYSGTVRNTGNITLTNVAVVSDRPAANTTVFTVASLAPGASAPFTASFTVPPTDCSVATTVAATGKDICAGTTTANSAVITCTIATTPSLAVTLACPAVSAATGAQITYTGTVRNSGNVTLNNVTVVDNQAVPPTVLTVPTLAAGAAANFTASFTAPADACSVSSTVTASGSDACTAAVVSNSASATCPLVTTPSLVVTQSCPENPVSPGGLLTYSGTIMNTGNVTLTNVVVINDHSGATPVFTTATLGPGASTNFTGSYVTLTNCSTTSTSTATGRSICGVAVTNTVSTTCPILTAPQIAVTAVCPPTPIVPGGTLTYSGTVLNTGNITLTNVAVVSDRPAANTTVFTVASLAPGASAPFTASFTVPPTDCSVATTVAATGKDICAGTTTANSAVITCTIATAPSLAVTLACPAVSAATGGQITYTGTVRNSGNVTLNNVTVVNNQAVPNTVLTVPTLAPGVSANFAASFTAPADACSVSSTVTASGSDACTAAVVSNSASATCPLVTTPGLVLTQNCPVDPLSPGGLVTYSGTVRNTGNITLTNVVVTSGGSGTTNTVNTLWVDDAAPAGSVLATFGGDAWNWVSSNPTPFSGTLAHQSLISPGLHQHVFKYSPTTFPINVGDVLVTYVYLDPANLPSEVMLEWQTNGSFEHRAYWGANSVNLGTDGTVSRHYMGPLPAVGQWVRLEVPANTVGLEGSALTGMAFTLYGGRATWDASGKAALVTSPPTPDGTTVFTAATLAPGAVADFTASYTLPAGSECSFTSTLTAGAADTCTGTRVTANVSTTCPVVTAPAIAVTQICPATLVLQGGLLTYSGTVRNVGNSTLTNIIVVNNRPTDNTVIFTAASLAPGATANFTGSYEVPINCCVVWSIVAASGQDCTGATVTDTDTSTCTVFTTPKIIVTKLCPPQPVEPGDVLQYSGTVSNAGNITLIDVTAVNTQSPDGSPLFGSITLAPGESVSYMASYTVPADFCGTDTVTAQGLDACSFAPVVNSVTTTCPVITTPRIAVTKNCPAEATPRGGVLTFTGTVSNPGNVTLTNVIVVNNYQADCYSRTNGPVIGPITLAPGATVNFSGSYTAPQSCCEVVDTLTASGQDRCAGTRVTATATALCPLLSTPRITVARVCPATEVPVGGMFTYSGSVSNAGDVVLTNVYVTSSQPNTNTLVLGPIELAPGETKLFSGSYTVTTNSDPTTDTVKASGTDTCQGQTVTAMANCSGPVFSLTITSVTVTNSMATVTWTATAGVTYRLQFRSNAQNSAWTNVPGDVTASGVTASKDDVVGTTNQRFYRIMIVH